MKILLVAVLLTFIVGCSKSQKEDVTKVVDDVTGISTVKQGQEMADKIDSITTLDAQRVDETIVTGDEE